jgi:hypothetical protein
MEGKNLGSAGLRTNNLRGIPGNPRFEIGVLRPLYNALMARGWESKSVEAQQAEASEEKRTPKSRMTPEQATHQRQLDGLVLSRQRVLQQLAAAHDPRHRQMLETALADLDRKIHDLK